jgi:hypothetical protein
VVVLLRGFSFDTDITHKDGYTSRGFAVKLGQAARSGDALKVPVTVRVQAGPVSDRVQGLDAYGATVTVGYTLVAVDRGHTTRQSLSYRMSYKAGVANPTQPHAGAGKARHLLAGQGGAAAALAGLAGFELRLNKGVTHFPGRYMRAVRLMNEKLSHDAAAGELTLWTDGYFSNSGLVSHALTVDFAADVVLVQLDDPAAKVVHEGYFGTASKTTSTGTQNVSF